MSPKAIIAILIAAMLGGFFFYTKSLKSDISDLQQTNAVLVLNNETLTSNVNTLKANVETYKVASEANLKASQDLLNERAAAKKVIAELATKTANDKKAIDTLSNRIADLMKDPKNDGPLAPVLRETMRSIQDNRK